MQPIRSSEPLIGWRGWRVLHPHYLVGGNLVYEPRKRHEAHCGDDHLAPDLDCTCGIYSFKSFDELADQKYLAQDIIGEIALWGKIVEHKVGYRAQYAYPRKLYVGGNTTTGRLSIDVTALANYIGYLYGVPVEVNDKIAKYARPNFGYAVTATGQSPAVLYKLPPKQQAIIRELTRLQKIRTPVPRETFRKSLASCPPEEFQVAELKGHGMKDERPKADDPWVLFEKQERRWVEQGILTRTFKP